jgi:hypothetical protein
MKQHRCKVCKTQLPDINQADSYHLKCEFVVDEPISAFKNPKFKGLGSGAYQAKNQKDFDSNE